MSAARASRMRAALLLASLLLAAPAPAQPPPGADSTAAPAPASPGDPAIAPAARARATRAGWLSDRFPLRVGDIVTVVVDDQTAAREQVSKVAVGNRGQRANLNAGLPSGSRVGPEKAFGTRLDSDSRDIGEARRVGDLTAVLSARVTALEPDGLARIRGSKKVTVDGRLQEITVEGLVRPQDVGWDNAVLSGSIAEAVITYNGKKIGPRTGIVGRILNLLWP